MRRDPRSVANACATLYRLTGVGCCESCGQDASEGYSICEIESPDRDWRGGRWWASACCTHASMEPDDVSAKRLWWAILVRASGKMARGPV